jgi:ferritin-like metal-binding protein YciE
LPDSLNARDAKLVQWLNEAHAKEAELEADLTAHIALTEKMPYKKRLRKHLTETRDHKRRVASRIKKLGSKVAPATSVPGVPDAMGEVAGKAVAAVKGQVGTARALVTNQAETHLRNAQEELREEHVEIAIYNRIETFATEVGDRETAQLARSIRRDEERMAKFLDAELKRLVKEVVRAEVPRELRSKPRSRRTTTSRSRSTSNGSSSGSRSRSASSSRSSGTSSRSGSSRSSGTSRSGASRSSGSTRSSASRSSGSTRSSGSARSGGSTRNSGSSRSSGGSTSGSGSSGTSRRSTGGSSRGSSGSSRNGSSASSGRTSRSTARSRS